MKESLIDIDGTIAPTYGRCKEGMDISYKGIWGYAPLIISLANTREVLYLVNRSGNVPSHDGAAEWIGHAIELVKPYSSRILGCHSEPFAFFYIQRSCRTVSI